MRLVCNWYFLLSLFYYAFHSVYPWHLHALHITENWGLVTLWIRKRLATAVINLFWNFGDNGAHCNSLSMEATYSLAQGTEWEWERKGCLGRVTGLFSLSKEGLGGLIPAVLLTSSCNCRDPHLFRYFKTMYVLVVFAALYIETDSEEPIWWALRSPYNFTHLNFTVCNTDLFSPLEFWVLQVIQILTTQNKYSWEWSSLVIHSYFFVVKLLLNWLLFFTIIIFNMHSYEKNWTDFSLYEQCIPNNQVLLNSSR